MRSKLHKFSCKLFYRKIALIISIFCLSLPTVFSQIHTVTGTIIDDEGITLPGANIIEKGTTNGVVSDVNGYYSIDVSSGNAVLQISFVSYTLQEINVDNQSVINVVLQSDAAQLEEIVVTALGIAKQKKALTYSAQNVKTEELTQARSINVLNGLSGKVAGLSITTGSSGVGSASKVLLRGNRSINGSSQPLYVVDGILLNGDISNISPDDIQEISVLKGANAAALYGSRANNGAIIITTKSGKGSKKGVTTSIGFTSIFANPIHLLGLQNDYGQGSAGIYSKNALTSWGPKFDGSQVEHWSNDPTYSDFGRTYTYEAQPDNIKDFFTTGKNLATNLSVNINNDNTNTFIGYTFTDAGGIVPGNDLNRHNLTARVNSKLAEKLSVDTKINYIRDDLSNILTAGENYDNPYRYLYIIPRNIRTEDFQHYSFINPGGKLRQHYLRPYVNGGGNPYWTRNHVLNPRLDERVLGLLSMTYNFTDDLSLMARSTMDRSSRSEEQKIYNDTYTRSAALGSYTKRANNLYDWNTDVLLSYNKDITNDFGLNMNLGANQRVFKFNEITGRGETFTIENFFSLGNTFDPTATEAFDNFEVQSVYALAELSYKNALYLNLSARNDWSSTLPSDSRSYFYPSVGLTAIVSELFEMPKYINFLKLRGSWAEVGNDASSFSLSQRADIINGTLSINPNLPNASLRPETTRSTELGFVTRFADYRFHFDFTWYKTNTFDQIFRTPTPIGSGIASRFQNGADIQNTGVEIVLGASVFQNDNFSWDIDLNFAKNDSEVLEIAEGFDEITIQTDFIRSYKLVKGGRFGDVYSRGYQRDNQGRVIVDANGLPLITPGLDVQIANFTPDWLGGIKNTFRYKSFSLSSLIDIRKGGTLASFTEAILAGNGILDYTAQGREGGLIFGQNIFSDETAVTESGEPNNIALDSETLWNRFGGRNTPVGEPFVRDASNIRFRELVLAYKIPENLLSKTFFTSASVSFVGRNLFFFSNKAEHFDPESLTTVSNDPRSTDNGEITSEGREAFAAPTTRTLGFSVNFQF